MAHIDYVPCGEYLIPLIGLSDPPREQVEPITKYGAIGEPLQRA